MTLSKAEKKQEKIAKGKKRLKGKKLDALTCPFCTRDFSGYFYLTEHYCEILETQYKFYRR